MAYAHTGIFSLIENSHDPVRLVFSRLNVFDPGTFAVSTSCLLLLILSYTLRTTTLTAASRRYFPFKMAPLSPSDAFLHKTPRHYLLIHAGTERRQSPIASTVMCRLVGNGHTRECALALSFESIDGETYLSDILLPPRRRAYDAIPIETWLGDQILYTLWRRRFKSTAKHILGAWILQIWPGQLFPTSHQVQSHDIGLSSQCRNWHP